MWMGFLYLVEVAEKQWSQDTFNLKGALIWEVEN